MPESLPLFPLPEPTLKHLFLRRAPKRIDTKGIGRGTMEIRSVERREHAETLLGYLQSVGEGAAILQRQVLEERLPDIDGIVIELRTTPGYPLSTEKILALTGRNRRRTGPEIRLLNALQQVDADGEPFTRITLHVEFGGLVYLQEKVREYAEGSGSKNHAFLSNISSISIAALDALWTDDPEKLPRDGKLHWWQLWVRRRPEHVWQHFEQACNSLEIELRNGVLTLPDHKIVVARARYETLTASVPLLDTLAEVRGAHPCSLDLTDLTYGEQAEWVEIALDRVQFPSPDAPSVCLLDTGVTRGHKLLEPLIEPDDSHSIFADGDGSDGYRSRCLHGHGTPMAGLAAYGDLRKLVLENGPWNQVHRLESVRCLDPNQPHEPENYGFVTQQAILLPEINKKDRNRVYSLAITAPGMDDGSPSAWSAAVDAAAYGADDQSKRLVLISAGNVAPESIGENYTYPGYNQAISIEDPAQAWNAVTVGAITHRCTVDEGDDEHRQMVAVARRSGSLSPFSRTACDWDPHWPIKPEVVIEGGNAAIHPEQGYSSPNSLQLMSTSGFGIHGMQFCAFNATSAATAQAARLAIEIRAQYPDVWVETIRGLLVHCARWNAPMLDGINPHKPFKKKFRHREKFIDILRSYGYGEPDIGRGKFSAGHAATLIREDRFQPYQGKPGLASLKDCHIHELPWPRDLLQQYSWATMTLRVTLSYFVAPNPSANNALGSSRYRYAGCLLRFLVRHKEESEEKFQSRLERSSDEDEEKLDPVALLERTKTDSGWALGSKLRGKAGSLVHDVWEGPSAALLQMDRIAVYPAKGWWASRKFPAGDEWENCHQLPIRYSLLVSIECSEDIPLYNEIENNISLVT